MAYRSWLFVPGENQKKLARAIGTGADVIVVDLESPASREAKHLARRQAGEWLGVHRQQVLEHRTMARWVRIDAMESRSWHDDLVAVMRGAPEGIILPRVTGVESVRQLAAELYELEEVNRLPAGSTRIVPIVGETAQSAMSIGQFAEASLPRLMGLAWSAAGLAAAISATRTHNGARGWRETFGFVRAQCLLVAHACGLMAIESAHPDFADPKAMKAISGDARADGFTGMFAIHPAQVQPINDAFTPSDAELDEARRIVSAFEADPDGMALEIDRRSFSRSQVRLARLKIGETEPRGEEAARAPILRPA